MKIAVIGAGPVGLYAAGLLKNLYPDGRVHVYEKRSENQLSGFGYTLHDQSLYLLRVLHPDVENAIVKSGTSPFTRRTLTCRGKLVELDPEVSWTMPIIGVEYDSLLQVLKHHASQAEVHLHHETAIANPDDLALDHDLVVVANGANSAFLERFDPEKVDTGLMYAWGKLDAGFDEMAMSLDTTGDVPFICHKYPISNSATAMIVEVLEEHAGQMAQVLAQAPGTSRYFMKGAEFRKIPLCLCNKKADRNIVCIGDAALAQYFAAGAGLYFGLMQTGLLFHQLDRKPGTIAEKLQAYDSKAREFMQYQWQPNLSLIRKKQSLLRDHQDMTDEAVLKAMVTDE